MITFILCAEGVLQEPLLYLSLFFKENRDLYYAMLQRVRTEGAWEEWMAFYLQGIAKVSHEARLAGRSILGLFQNDREAILGVGKGAATCLKIHEMLKEKAMLSLKEAKVRTGLSYPAVSRAVTSLERLKIVREVGKKKRNRLFAYEGYLNILSTGIK